MLQQLQWHSSFVRFFFPRTYSWGIQLIPRYPEVLGDVVRVSRPGCYQSRKQTGAERRLLEFFQLSSIYLYDCPTPDIGRAMEW